MKTLAAPCPDRLPSISVVTPSYNQADFLDRTINSVVEQEYPCLEYLVLDGGSTDGSREILESHSAELDFWRSEPDGGQANAVNSGWQRSSGEVLGWINSDDYYLSGTLKFVGAYFRDNPSVELLYGQCLVVSADGRGLRLVGEPFQFSTMLYRHDVIPQPSAFLRRSLFDRTGGLDEALQYAMDYDFFIRASLDVKPAFVRMPLAAYTVHATAKTVRSRTAVRAETYQIRRRYARGAGRLLVAGQASASAAYHGLPLQLRSTLDRLRGIDLR